MKLKELKKIIDRQIDLQPSSAEYDVKVVADNGRKGPATKCVDLYRVFTGFDWDNGKYFLMSKEDLQVKGE